ncbi:MAG TPA: ComEA family DNA-binding protein [Verrucomicrobiae bacterium]|nr:ComEA family DNA-binding protein [Verrucomicrobiae bacterium]
MQRWLIVAAIVIVAALAIRHPAPVPPLATTGDPAASMAPHFEERRPTRRPPPTAPAVVYVVGAVRRPGLYSIAAGARINDAVRAAGGLRPDADPAGINLAARASDGDEVAVPVLGQPPRPLSSTKRSRTPRSRARKTNGVVDVNTASAQALASVPGIGETIAARIVAVREEEGTFTTFDQLLDVAGLTESRLERARPYLYL